MYENTKIDLLKKSTEGSEHILRDRLTIDRGGIRSSFLPEEIHRRILYIFLFYHIFSKKLLKFYASVFSRYDCFKGTLTIPIKQSWSYKELHERR